MRFSKLCGSISKICILGVVLISLLAITILLNPYVVGRIDSLIIQAPCCDKSPDLRFFDLCLWKLATIAFTRWTQYDTCDETDKECFEKGSCCKLCRDYQTLRCHMRMDELYLNRFFWWNECQMTNFTLHSEKDCHFDYTSDNYMYLSPYYLFNNAIESLNILQSSSREIMSMKKYNKKPLPAIHIKDLSINIHSISKPIVDVNASGIIINVLTEQDIIQIAPTIQIPLTIVRVGDWTLDALIAMIPPPPKEEGLYPRLGTVNLTDVRIYSHTKKQNVITSMSEIIVPDEFFYPLYQLTNLAGINGTDRSFIPTVIKKSIIMVLRKHAMNEEGLISKTMEGFISNIQKSSEFVNEVTRLLQGKLDKWNGMIDDGVDKVSKVLNQFIVKVEGDWNAAMNDENNPLSKLSKEAKFMWEGIDGNFSKAGDKVRNFLEKMESEFHFIAQNSQYIVPQITKDVKDGWKTIQKSVKEVEDDLNIHAKQAEENLEKLLKEVTNNAMKGINKAKVHFRHFVTDLLPKHLKNEL